MPYEDVKQSFRGLDHHPDNLLDWRGASPGQWFIGVVDTSKKKLFVVPVNVFEGRGELNQGTLNNTNARGMNRYASGAPGERTGSRSHISTHGIAGEEGNWLENRRKDQTHHTAVAHHYGSSPEDCLGFTLIKSTGAVAMLKCSSTSLNARHGGRPCHSFSRATRMDAPGFVPGSAQMPDDWTNALLEYFPHSEFGITTIVKSND